MSENKIYEVLFHARGGMGAVTAAELLCDMAFQEGFRDVLSVPLIGAERRGAPIRANARISQSREIKNYSEVKDPDITLIFDTSLLTLPGVLDGIKHGNLLLNTNEDFDVSSVPKDITIYTVDATKISLDVKLVVAGSPVLNVPMLGAYAKITNHFTLNTMRKVLEETFGSKAALNIKAAELAFEQVKKIR